MNTFIPMFITGAGIALIGLMLLVLVRAVKGPTVIDRLVAINVIGTNAVGEIVGRTTTVDLLDSIFSTFCIGK